MTDANNKFPVGGRLGDAPPHGPVGEDGDRDFAADSAGLPSSGVNETQTDMAMNLEPNKFPRETGHDSLSEEEAVLS